jgi:hypothetical protein
VRRQWLNGEGKIVLTFNATGHQYFWHGKPVPDHVTKVLGLVTDLSRIPTDVLENARQEGVDEHRMVNLHATGDLDEDVLPAWLRPKLAGLRKFFADTEFRMIGSETAVYHRLYKYAGTLDLVGEMRYQRHKVRAIIDVKRSLYAGRAIGLQTAAYLEAWSDSNPNECRPTHRFALRLRDGDYRLEPYTQRDDFSLFLACLSVHRLKEQM